MFLKKIVSLLLFVSLSVGYLPAEDDYNLTDIQLHAFLGIMTNFILCDVDSDGDGIPDILDTDDDNDGVLDVDDAFPLDASESVDTDGDGIGNNADTDDDGDGASDADEVVAGTDPLNPDELVRGGLVYKTVTSPYTGHKWLDRNLGASQVCTSFDNAACYGDYYQWGRDTDGHEKSGSATTNVQADMSPPPHNKFIKWHEDWVTGYDHNYPNQRATHWSQRDGSSVCPVGFRVPTFTELKLETLDNGVTNRATAFSGFLKLPSAGVRDHASGDMIQSDTAGYLWSSSVENMNSYIIGFRNSSTYENPDDPAYGLSVRCMKPVITTDMPPVLTLHTDAQIEMMQFGTYPIIRVTAVDDVDGIIGSYVVATDPYGQTYGLLNTSISGVHTISYTATDSAGHVSNTVTVTVTIHPAMKKTGQTNSYDTAGDEVTDGSLKDDGYYQKGHVPLYVRDAGNEIVTDNITGLQWQDDADVADSGNKKRWLTAISYCNALELGGYEDWRLPSVDELGSILDRGTADPAIDETYFKNVASYNYWSSSTNANGSDQNVWVVTFNSGSQFMVGKNNKANVRCVRVRQ